MKTKLKLKKTTKKAIFTLAIFVINVILYDYLQNLGCHVGESTLIDSVLVVGWTWLVIGSTMSLLVCWELDR